VASAVVVVSGREVASSGMRISQWSSGELVGMKVGVGGSPTCNSDVFVRKFVKALY
jgi:hypothetical protein